MGKLMIDGVAIDDLKKFASSHLCLSPWLNGFWLIQN